MSETADKPHPQLFIVLASPGYGGLLQYSFSGSPVDSEPDSSPLLSPHVKQPEVRARKRPWVRVLLMRMSAVYRSAVSRVEAASLASACTGDLLDVLTQAG